MKILVTGAAGFIGSHLCERLAQKGHRVIGVDNFSDYYDPKLKRMNAVDVERAGVKILEIDLRDELINLLPTDIDLVYHLAAQPGNSPQTSYSDYEENNILATQNLLNWAIHVNKNTLLFINIATSSIYGVHATSSEDGNVLPVSDYGMTKLAAEQLVLTAHSSGRLPACSIRLYSVYGPRERPEKLYTKLISAIFNEIPFPLFENSENHERSFTYVGDIIDGLESITESIDECNGEIINLGNSAVHTTKEGITLIEKLLDKKAIMKVVPPRAGDQLKTSAIINKAEKILNYVPKTSFEEGLKNQVSWYKEKFVKKTLL